MRPGSARAVVFMDGANLYHALKGIGMRAKGIDPYLVARKLVETRRLVEMRYYIAEIGRSAPGRVLAAYQDVRALLARRADVRMCMGHIQRVRENNPCARELGSFLARTVVRLPPEVYRS